MIMPDVTLSQPGKPSQTVNGAAVAETGGDVRVNKAGIGGEVQGYMDKIDSDDNFSIESGGAVIVGLTYDAANSDANSIRFTK